MNGIAAVTDTDVNDLGIGKAPTSQKSHSGPLSGMEKAHKHKQNFPVTARLGGGGSPDPVARGLQTGWPGARGQKLMCCVRNPRNINILVQVPGREDRVPGREDQ